MSGPQTRLLSTSHGTNREAFSGSDWALFVSLALIWGSSFLFIDIGLDHFHPGLVTLLRVGFGAATLALVPRARRQRIARQDWPRVAALGLIWIALPLSFFPIAQQWINSAVAGMLNGAMPIFTAVVAVALLRELPGRRQTIGLLLGFAGIAAISLSSARGTGTAFLGVALVLAATICYAISTNIVTPLQQKYGSLPVLARVQWVAAPLVVPYGLIGLGDSEFAWSSLAATLAVGVFGTGLAFVLMGTLTGRVGATRASFITYCIPLVALLLGVVFRSDQVAAIAVVGVVLVIVGAFLASRREA
ncbi:MAG TPA: DMT family transporter [Acidimicrobiia bacterium]|nr:DMT family transporter [Acidimicrobiia bacterium]